MSYLSTNLTCLTNKLKLSFEPARFKFDLLTVSHGNSAANINAIANVLE